MPSGAFNICCPRDCVSRHNGGTSGAPLKPLRVDSTLRALSTLRGLRGVPEGPPLCRETSVSRTANVGTVGMNGLTAWWLLLSSSYSNFFLLFYSNCLLLLLFYSNCCCRTVIVANVVFLQYLLVVVVLK